MNRATIGRGLRRFIHSELNIENVVEFGNIHRFGKRHEDGRPRPIVARFIYHNDLVMVRCKFKAFSSQ
jgi:hypothetical protein